MAATPVIPTEGLTPQIAEGGQSQVAIPAGPDGGVITNPITATEYLMVNPIGNASLTIGGSTFGLAPGQTWDVIPGQTTPTSVIAATTGHVFSAVYWNAQ